MTHNMNKVQMLEFPQRGDERGHLVIVEGNKDIPFEIKRAFYIYGLMLMSFVVNMRIENLNLSLLMLQELVK